MNLAKSQQPTVIRQTKKVELKRLRFLAKEKMLSPK
jgi:hypothetical protein